MTDVSEADRLSALQLYRIADTDPEETFDRFARIAQRLFDAPIGLVTLVDATHQSFKACYGLAGRGTERVDSFCTHAIDQDDTLVILDAERDERVRDNPQVTGPPHLRFYAGAPLRSRGGHVLGTLCVLDTKPRARPTADLLQTLEELADATMDAIERRLHGMELAAARARERREAERMGARGAVLERITRHDPLPEILADVAAMVDDTGTSATGILEVRGGTVVMRSGAGGVAPVEAADATDLPDAIQAVVAGAPSVVNAPAEAADAWPARWAGWLRVASPARWSAVPLTGEAGNVRAVAVSFERADAEDPDGATPHTLRIEEAVGLGSVAIHQADLIEQLQHSAHHDALTGLPNRALLGDRLEQAIRRAERDGSDVSVLMLDVDDFKEINDTMGHPAGDLVLVEVARRIAGCVRAEDTVARFGGDEFVVVLRSAERGPEAAQRILAALSRPHRVHDRSVPLAPSIGVARWPEDGRDPDTLLAAADVAMYQAKQAGKGTVR